MKKYLYALKSCPLFADITDENISAMTNCLDMRVKKYSKGEYIYNSGDYLKSVSIVAEGSLFLQKDDLFGNRTIVRKLNVGDIFGEAYAVQNDEPLLNDVTANEDSVILSFQMSKILSQCNNVCEFHAKLIKNLIRSISEKIVSLRKEWIVYPNEAQEINCLLILCRNQKSIRAVNSLFRLTENSLLISFLLTEVLCQMSFAKCVMKDCWNSTDAISSCCYEFQILKMTKNVPRHNFRATHEKISHSLE